MHDDAGPDLQTIANMACGRISGKVPWAPTCIDRSGSVAGRDALSSAPAHATGISVRLQGAVDGRPFDDVVIKAESADGSPAVLELRAKRTIDFTGGSRDAEGVQGAIRLAAPTALLLPRSRFS